MMNHEQSGPGVSRDEKAALSTANALVITKVMQKGGKTCHSHKRIENLFFKQQKV